MAFRERERDTRVLRTGSLWDRSVTPNVLIATGQKTEGAWDRSADYVGNRTVANPLELRKITTAFPTLTGKSRSIIDGRVLKEFIDYPVDFRPQPADPRSQFPGYSVAELHDFAWKILAETNPQTPHVSVPSFVGELKDIPGTIRGLGGDLLMRTMRSLKGSDPWIKRVRDAAIHAAEDFFGKPGSNRVKKYLHNIAAGHLSWRWAIKPLIGDLRAMTEFAKASNERLKWLKRLRDGKTMRKRCSLGSYRKSSGRQSRFLHSFHYGLNGWAQTVYTARVWGSAEWKILPDSPIFSMDDEELKYFSRQLAAGFTSHELLASAWELCPWSWFVDWFSNCGEMIAATNNSVGMTYGRICVMRQSKSSLVVELDKKTSNSWCTLNGYWASEFERKDRHPVLPLLPFPLPRLALLDQSKWSILAALTILRS